MMKFNYLTLFILSSLLHIAALVLINSWKRGPSEPKHNPVTIKFPDDSKNDVQEVKKEVEALKRKPLKPKRLIRENRPDQEEKKTTAAPVFGVRKDSLNNPGTGLSVPIGNTLMVEDDGKRVKDPGELKDLSRDAQLIASSVKIKYTESAIDAGIQGLALADVLVDLNGFVVEVSLPRKIGFGMDESIKKAALESKFLPRLDRNGQAQMGWTQVKFILTLE